MSASDPASAAAELAELIGEHGRAEIAYRLARESSARPAQRWEPVLQTLARAYGLAAGLAAGQTTTPTGHEQGAMQPCQACEGQTAIRVYGQPWHYTCWLSAGCPLAAAKVAEAPESQSTGLPESDSAELSEAVTGAETPAEATPGTNGQEHPAEERSAPYKRRKKDRASEEGTDGQRYQVDPDEERDAFTREIRRRFPEATEEECAAALAAWHEHVRVLDRPFQFQSSAGYSGVLLYELLTAAHGSMPQPEPLASETVHAITGAETTLHKWSFLDPDAAPQPGEMITELDVTAQYLAAARSVECGDGEPEIRTDAAELAQWLDTLQDRPGYLELATAPDLSSLPPHARHTLADLDAGWTLPNPAVKYLRKDHGIELDPARAVVWPKDRRGRRLEVWATRVDEARRSLQDAADADQPGAAIALTLVKVMYATFLGGLLRSEEHNDRGTYRPDWHDLMVSTAAMNALRAWDRAAREGLGEDVRLVGGLKDAFWLVSPAEAAPVRPAGLGYADQEGKDHRRPGKWHLNRWCQITEDMREAHTDGRVGTLQRLIVAGADAREEAESQ